MKESKNRFIMSSFKLLIISIVMFFAFGAKANNVQIGTPTVTNDVITFTVQWDNSWRVATGPSNWDAVWLFVKWQDCNNQRKWTHADLVAAGCSVVSGAVTMTSTVTSDNKGMFLYRQGTGQGNIPSTTVNLKLNTAGIPGWVAGGTNMNFEVFGIEMVYITPGSYDLGDASEYADGWCDAFNNYTVTNETTAIAAGMLGANATHAAIPATFPKGTGLGVGANPIYCMKYEITVQQYVDFLNELTYLQQSSRLMVSPNSAAGSWAYTRTNAGGYNYGGIVISSPGTNNMIPAVLAADCNSGNYDNFDDCQTYAMNYLSWADLGAFLDWACLRPMSELEFEKICRGSVPRVAGEYAWGDVNINYITPASLSNSGQSNEVSSLSSLGLCNYGYSTVGSLGGPMRVGMLAKATTVRNQAGTTYYGVADMSGNVAEQCVGVGAGANGAVVHNSATTYFTGKEGDGNVDANGNFDGALVADWPTIVAGTDMGIGIRGGHFYCRTDANYTTANGVTSSIYALRVSDRIFMYNSGGGVNPWCNNGWGGYGTYSSGLDQRLFTNGGRGVRKAN
ncbi:MAG: hypothetical protein Q8880_00710 [Bacteroidota bacterium]|nr:hypothetical protein [Bacteroidota bacterium]